MSDVTIVPLKSEPHYSEISQPNPIRFRSLKQTGENTYQAVSGKWKCKDFMNEAVLTWHTGESFEIYGFYSKPEYLNKESDHFPLLAYITVPWQDYENNLALVNDYLMSEGQPAIDVILIKDKEVLLKLPLRALDNTYFMSVYTLLVRLANTKGSFSTVEDLFSKQPVQEKKLIQSLKAKPPSEFPEEQEDYIMLQNAKVKGCFVKKGDVDALKNVSVSCNHDCGLQRWGGNNSKFTLLSEMPEVKSYW